MSGRRIAAAVLVGLGLLAGVVVLASYLVTDLLKEGLL